MSRRVQGKFPLIIFCVGSHAVANMLTLRTSRTWLMDLSTRLPKAQLDGLDITLKATPPKGWLPPNVTMREWDVREPVPEDLVEKYDIVHVRYLCLVLSDAEVSSVLENVTKLLSEYYQHHARRLTTLGYVAWRNGTCPMRPNPYAPITA